MAFLLISRANASEEPKEKSMTNALISSGQLFVSCLVRLYFSLNTIQKLGPLSCTNFVSKLSPEASQTTNALLLFIFYVSLDSSTQTLGSIPKRVICGVMRQNYS
jgi:hypothetical protein